MPDEPSWWTITGDTPAERFRQNLPQLGLLSVLIFFGTIVAFDVLLPFLGGFGTIVVIAVLAGWLGLELRDRMLPTEED